MYGQSARLADFLVVQGTLEIAEVIDEQLAVEVIGFMLHGCAVVAVTFKMNRVPIQIQSVERNASGAFDQCAIIRHGQTALIFGMKSGIEDGDSGVDQGLEFLPSIRIFQFCERSRDDEPFEHAI